MIRLMALFLSLLLVGCVKSKPPTQTEDGPGGILPKGPAEHWEEMVLSIVSEVSEGDSVSFSFGGAWVQMPQGDGMPRIVPLKKSSLAPLEDLGGGLGVDSSNNIKIQLNNGCDHLSTLSKITMINTALMDNSKIKTPVAVIDLDYPESITIDRGGTTPNFPSESKFTSVKKERYSNIHCKNGVMTASHPNGSGIILVAGENDYLLAIDEGSLFYGTKLSAGQVLEDNESFDGVKFGAQSCGGVEDDVQVSSLGGCIGQRRFNDLSDLDAGDLFTMTRLRSMNLMEARSYSMMGMSYIKSIDPREMDTFLLENEGISTLHNPWNGGRESCEVNNSGQYYENGGTPLCNKFKGNLVGLKGSAFTPRDHANPDVYLVSDGIEHRAYPVLVNGLSHVGYGESQYVTPKDTTIYMTKSRIETPIDKVVVEFNATPFALPSPLNRYELAYNDSDPNYPNSQTFVANYIQQAVFLLRKSTTTKTIFVNQGEQKKKNSSDNGSATQHVIIESVQN